MAASRDLPARPSLESIRKQAKKLTRDGTMSLRDAQLALAREYGFAGWRDLVAEVTKRTDQGIDAAGAEARRVIHDNDTDRLKELIAAHPALVSWRDAQGETLLAFASGAFGDAGDDFREESFTRLTCAEMLIDAGAEVDQKIVDSVIQSRARHLFELLERKKAVPQTVEYSAARGDLDAVRRFFDQPNALQRAGAALDRAFNYARRFRHKEVMTFLLDRMIDVNHGLGARIESGPGRASFIDFLCERTEDFGSPWQTFVTCAIFETIKSDDRAGFERWLQREPDLRGPQGLDLQVRVIEVAVYTHHGPLIQLLFDHDPAILHADPPPASNAINFAYEYAEIKLLPMLTRVWPVPDDLPHAAGIGDLERVKRWFTADGKPNLGELSQHHPANHPDWRGNLQWGPPGVQQVLDVALAWACMNNQFEVAGFLLDHGADINTNWSSHEPASILHELVWHANYEAMQFLIDRGIDMTIHDYRWRATAEGWARYAQKHSKLADFLAAAAAKRRPPEAGKKATEAS